jgi:diaminopimelate epimerase
MEYQAAGNTFYLYQYTNLVDLEHWKQNIGTKDGLVVWDYTDYQTTHNTQSIVWTVWNTDLSVAQTCGNALRCLHKHIFQHTFQSTNPQVIYHVYNTLDWANPTPTKLVGVLYPNNHVGLLVPKSQSIQCYKTQSPWATISFSNTIHVPNPHWVWFFPVYFTKLLQTSLVPKILGFAGQRPCFFKLHNILEVCNINLAIDKTIDPNKPTIQLVVYERGVGLTQACGSGALATSLFHYYHINKKIGTNIQNNIPNTVQNLDHMAPIPYVVHMPGGTLCLTLFAHSIADCYVHCITVV